MKHAVGSTARTSPVLLFFSITIVILGRVKCGMFSPRMFPSVSVPIAARWYFFKDIYGCGRKRHNATVERIWRWNGSVDWARRRTRAGCDIDYPSVERFPPRYFFQYLNELTFGPDSLFVVHRLISNAFRYPPRILSSSSNILKYS